MAGSVWCCVRSVLSQLVAIFIHGQICEARGCPLSDELDDVDVAEFDDGDSDEETDVTDEKMLTVEEGDSCTDRPEKGVVHCSTSSTLYV